MVVASSSHRWEVEKHLKDAGVEDYFLNIVCGDMIVNSKSALDIYMKVCEMIDRCRTERMICVGRF